MKGSSLRVGRELAEAFTGNSAVVADLWAARLRNELVKLAPRFTERSIYSSAEIPA